MDELLGLGYVPSDACCARQAPGDTTSDELASAQIDTEDRVYQACWHSGVYYAQFQFITRRLFVYGFSKRGLCMASNQNRINYFLHDSERHT